MENVPKTLQAWMDRHPGVIADVDYGDGFACETGYSYDVLLAPGWVAIDDQHILIESNLRRLMNVLSTVHRED